MTRQKPEKVNNLKVEIQEHLERGSYIYTRHAQERMVEREVNDLEVVEVLEFGRWTKARDVRSKELDDEWSYCIEGKTLDERRLRIIVAFERLETCVMMVVTVIDLDLD